MFCLFARYFYSCKYHYGHFFSVFHKSKYYPYYNLPADSSLQPEPKYKMVKILGKYIIILEFTDRELDNTTYLHSCYLVLSNTILLFSIHNNNLIVLYLPKGFDEV